TSLTFSSSAPSHCSSSQSCPPPSHSPSFPYTTLFRSPEQFIASDGTVIFVGHNNKQNEYVTHKLAHRNDIWLHALNIPGSHVVIKDDNPSEETLYEAAQLAAFYSKAGQSASVPVDYTEVRHVKKPSGAKPGFVTYTHQKTLSVTPDATFIQNLRKNKPKE